MICPHIEVVIVSGAPRGDGKATPYRTVTQYHSLDGKLLSEKDPLEGYAP